MSETDTNDSPLSAKTKINEALSILHIVGLPRAQQNERSARRARRADQSFIATNGAIRHLRVLR